MILNVHPVRELCYRQCWRKQKKANPATLVKICNSVVDDISTTLSLDQMVSLAKDVTKYKINSTTGFPTDLTTKNMPRCGDTVIPADLVTNVKNCMNTCLMMPRIHHHRRCRQSLTRL